MAIGPALSIAVSLLTTDRCEFFVLGEPEPQTHFLRLVDVYRTGGVPSSDLTRLSLAESEAFRNRVRTVRTMIRQGAGMTVEPDDSCIHAASLLETELAMSFATQLRWEDADSHFDAAWEISHLIEGRARRLSYQRDWLLAAGLFLHQLIFAHTDDEGGFTRAERFLHNAVKRYPDDPEVLLAAGSILEWAGSLRWGESAHLKEAEELYARAQRAAPLDPLILLRHGKVLEKLGRYGEAQALLLRVLELPADPDVHYRSRMALGGMAERGSELESAIPYYEAAVNLITSWQVAHLALGHALHASGAHERAREALDAALSLKIEEADKVYGGWWSYELGISLRFEPLFQRMRAEVRR